MHAELAATRESMLKLILVRKVAALLRLEQMHYLRLLEKFSAWRRNNGFNRSEVSVERQRRT